MFALREINQVEREICFYLSPRVAAQMRGQHGCRAGGGVVAVAQCVSGLTRDSVLSTRIVSDQIRLRCPTAFYKLYPWLTEKPFSTIWTQNAPTLRPSISLSVCKLILGWRRRRQQPLLLGRTRNRVSCHLVFSPPSRSDNPIQPTKHPRFPSTPRNPYKRTQAPLLSPRYSQHSSCFTLVVRVLSRAIMAQAHRTGC